MSRVGDVTAAIGVARIGDGYVLRTDGVAVGLAELTPPDMRLLDDAALAALLAQYTAALARMPDRFLLYTYATPPDMRPLLARMRAAAAAAPDLTGHLVLETLALTVERLAQAAAHTPVVRWILAAPTEAPDDAAPGMWSDLAPPPPPRALPGDAPADALRRIRRLIGMFAALGVEPPPRRLRAGDIRDLLRMGFDPIGAYAGAPAIADGPALPFDLAPDALPPDAGGEAPPRVGEVPPADAPAAARETPPETSGRPRPPWHAEGVLA
jgi:hypothetical protein